MERGTHHSFDTGLAAEYGIVGAVLIHHLRHWINVNARLKKNKREGRTWTYQTIEHIAANFEYLTKKQVEKALNKLYKDGVIIKGNFNKSKYDRTVWYAFENEEKFSISPNEEMVIPERGNQNPQKRTPIPYPKTDTKKEEEYKTESEDRFLVSFLFSKIQEKNQKAKKPNEDNWQKEFKLMMERDNRTKDEVKEIIEWAYSTDFWPGVIRSPSSIRKNYDQMFIQMQLSKKKGNVNEEENKELAKKVVAKYQEKAQTRYCRIEALNNAIEICTLQGSKLPSVVKYSEKGFRDQLENILRKWQII